MIKLFDVLNDLTNLQLNLCTCFTWSHKFQDFQFINFILCCLLVFALEEGTVQHLFIFAISTLISLMFWVQSELSSEIQHDFYKKLGKYKVYYMCDANYLIEMFFFLQLSFLNRIILISMMPKS